MPVFPLGRETVPLVLPVDILPELLLFVEEPEEPEELLLFDVELLLTPPLPLEEV